MMKAYLSAALLMPILALLLATLRLQWLDSGQAQYQDERVLRIGYAIEPPYSMLDQNGRITGEAPEVLRAVLQSAGIQRSLWLYSDFGNLLDELTTGRIDLIASGMFITPERSQRALFTRPTLQVTPGLLTLPDNPHRLGSMLDLRNRPTLRLTVIDGSVEMQQATAAGLAHLLPMPDVRSAMQAVLLGDADALALSLPALHYHRDIQDIPFEVLTDTQRARLYGNGATAFVLRQTYQPLRQVLDQALADYLGSPPHQQLLLRLGIAAGAQPAREPQP